MHVFADARTAGIPESINMVGTFGLWCRAGAGVPCCDALVAMKQVKRHMDLLDYWLDRCWSSMGEMLRLSCMYMLHLSVGEVPTGQASNPQHSPSRLGEASSGSGRANPWDFLSVPWLRPCCALPGSHDFSNHVDPCNACFSASRTVVGDLQWPKAAEKWA